MTKTTPNISSKRPYIQNVWNHFTANSGKKPKIEKEKNSKPNFRFGKGPEPESVYKSEIDAKAIVGRGKFNKLGSRSQLREAKLKEPWLGKRD